MDDWSKPRERHSPRVPSGTTGSSSPSIQVSNGTDQLSPLSQRQGRPHTEQSRRVVHCPLRSAHGAVELTYQDKIPNIVTDAT